MIMQTVYSRELKTWIAYFNDEKGNQVGDTQYGYSKEYAAFLLGCEYGSKPVKFSRPLSEILNADE